MSVTNNFARFVVPKNELIGRRDEINFLKESMFKKRMKNTILIGNAGCGKSTILQQFAYEMGHFFKIIEFDIAACVGGTRLRGEFEEKMINFLDEIVEYNSKSSEKIILYIDEIHNLYNAGGAEGAIDASNILKSYLSNGLITIIGATTYEEYQRTIAKDSALNRRLSPIFIKDLDDETNILILKKFNESVIDEALIPYIYEKSKALKKTNPDIAIEILDRCMAKKKYTHKTITETTVNKIVNFMKKN